MLVKAVVERMLVTARGAVPRCAKFMFVPLADQLICTGENKNTNVLVNLHQISKLHYSNLSIKALSNAFK